MTFPTVGSLDDEERAKVRAQFTQILSEAPEPGEQPYPRKRGRPPGSKNRPKPSDYEPIYTTPTDLPILASPPLTQRDQKEVAKRLAGILTGVTGVASVAKPYFQMTDEEAEAIATPLSTYLIRQESTSGVAKQVLEEYDLAAFVIALAAYMVRVYLDAKAERDDKHAEPRNVTTTDEDTPESRREHLRTVAAAVPESSVQSQEGTERPVSRESASASEIGWTPSGI